MALATVKSFPSREEFVRRANSYFRKCENDGKMVTVAGLARALGVTTRVLRTATTIDTVYNDLIDEYMGRLEERFETELFGKSFNGAKFELMNNFGWAEKTENKHDNSFEVTWNTKMDEKIEELKAETDMKNTL